MKKDVISTKECQCISFLFMLALWLVGIPVKAQDVTISPSTGKLIAGATYEGETGFENGSSSTWRHNQLPLSLYVSDKSDLTESGTLKDPAGNISLYNDQYVLLGGEDVRTRMNISLPKGYRFTQYKIVLENNINNKTINNIVRGSTSKILYETNSDFDYSQGNYLEATETMGSENEPDKKYVIERTSKTATDMGNNLYFYFAADDSVYYGATIKSIELWFTAATSFTVDGTPETSAISSDGKNMVAAPFKTGKLDLGEVTNNKTQNGQTYFSYNYENVRELTAYNYLYESDNQYNAVTNNTLPATAGTGNIEVLQNGDNMYYALGNGTYYIETPTSTTDQTNKSIPLGYRITGATINVHYGTESSPYNVSYGYITTNPNNFLNNQGTFSSSKTPWTLTDGKLKSGNYYLTILTIYYDDNYYNYTYYYLGTTTDESEAYSNFSISNEGYLMADGYYAYLDDDSKLSFTDSNDYSSNYLLWTGSTKINPPFTPSPYTINVYGTSKDGVVNTKYISSSSDDQDITVSGLNNDAVKITISGLADCAKALITYQLTMEALNPFINTLDIECTSDESNKPVITQQFTSSDFKVAGGKFTYYVPTDYATKHCTFTFKNLYSKYMDNTYGHNTNGNARNYLVKSDYYNKYGDGSQYQAKGDEAASTKVETAYCGDVPFRFNNADELANTTTGITSASLEEYPFSITNYENQTQKGTFSTVQLKLDNSDNKKKCYLFTGDETRYNIAPTTAMEHRSYAFYEMDLVLKSMNYDITCKLNKVYDKTLYLKNNGQEASDPMYGATFKAYQQGTTSEVPETQAFMTTDMMKTALTTALNTEKADANQVLYLDLSNFYSVALDKTATDAFKQTLNPNALIFLPYSTNYAADNYAKKTLSGSFQACENIVLTDQQPFYSPYKITVPAENVATYTRKITPKYGAKYNLATVVLPFSLELTDGAHTNEDGSAFEVKQMVTNNCLSATQEQVTAGDDYTATAHFTPVTSARTQPNQPYMVNVTKFSNDANTTFVATQRGSDIAATDPNTTDGVKMATDYTFEGETAQGTIVGKSYTFTNHGSFSGQARDKAKGFFYFARGQFNCSKDLSNNYSFVSIYPFRAWYDYSSTGSGSKFMSAFDVSFEDNNSATGIDDITMNYTGLNITTGKGFISIRANDAQQVQVVNVAGQTFSDAYLLSGETERVNVPAGVYIVNSQKVIVK